MSERRRVPPNNNNNSISRTRGNLKSNCSRQESIAIVVAFILFCSSNRNSSSKTSRRQSILIIFSWSRECKTHETRADEVEEQRICLLLLYFTHLRFFRHVFYHVSWFLQHDNCMWMTTLQPVDACKQALRKKKKEEEQWRWWIEQPRSLQNLVPIQLLPMHCSRISSSSSLFVHKCSTSLSFFFVHLFAGVFFVAASKSVGWL